MDRNTCLDTLKGMKVGGFRPFLFSVFIVSLKSRNEPGKVSRFFSYICHSCKINSAHNLTESFEHSYGLFAVMCVFH